MRLIAIGTRMPDWVDAAFEDYTRRLRGAWELKLTALAPARRRQGGDSGRQRAPHGGDADSLAAGAARLRGRPR